MLHNNHNNDWIKKGINMAKILYNRTKERSILAIVLFMVILVVLVMLLPSRESSVIEDGRMDVGREIAGEPLMMMTTADEGFVVDVEEIGGGGGSGGHGEALQFKKMAAAPPRGAENVGAAVSQDYDVGRGEVDMESLVNTDRMMIYNAYMDIRVKDLSEFRTSFETILKESPSSYIANMNINNNHNIYITARVTSAQLTEVMSGCRKLGQVYNENVNAEDVTEQYVDHAARAKSLEATHKQMANLLSQAANVREVLEIQRELSRITERMESAKARMEYLKRNAALSTLTINAQKEYQGGGYIKSWSPLKTIGQAFNSLWSAIKGLIDVIIYVVIVGIPILLVAGLVYIAASPFMGKYIPNFKNSSITASTLPTSISDKNAMVNTPAF